MSGMSRETRTVARVGITRCPLCGCEDQRDARTERRRVRRVERQRFRQALARDLLTSGVFYVRK